MTEKLIGAVILGVTVAIYVWVRDQGMYELHKDAYLGFTLAAIILARRTSA